VCALKSYRLIKWFRPVRELQILRLTTQLFVKHGILEIFQFRQVKASGFKTSA